MRNIEGGRNKAPAQLSFPGVTEKTAADAR